MSALLPNWLNEVVAIRLHSYFSSNDLLPSCQSAYRKHYSTETAMLRVWSNILMAADQRQVTLLALLDMSAAFDCVLLRRLQIYFGLSNAPLEWIRSFLSDRTYQLAYGGDLSHTYLLQYGVPQGSVLGPLLHVLYTAEVCHVVERHSMHLYICTQMTANSTPVWPSVIQHRLCIV